MAEKDTEQNADEAAVEETEAATPAVDEGAPVASSDAADQQGEAQEEAAEPVVADEVPAADEAMVAEPEQEAPVASAEPAPEPEPAAEEAVAEAELEPAEPEPAAEAPAEDAPAAESPAAETPAAPAQQSGPKPKRKRLPRSLRPQRTRPKRDKAALKAGERKPIVRLPKPEQELGRRQERQGTVVSDAMDKTIVVKVDTIGMHRRYKKVIRQSKKFHAHDETNQAKVGDVVRIVETRPLSKSKNWRLAEILEVAK